MPLFDRVGKFFALMMQNPKMVMTNTAKISAGQVNIKQFAYENKGIRSSFAINSQNLPDSGVSFCVFFCLCCCFWCNLRRNFPK